MTEKQVFFEDLGNVSLRKTQKAKNLRITVSPGKGITVSVPFLVSWNTALRFVEEKKHWIKESMERLKEKSPETTLFVPGVDFRIRNRILLFEEISGNEIKAKVYPDRIMIYYPSLEYVFSKEGQAFIKKALAFAIRREAKNYLPLRLKELATQHGFSYKDVFVKDLKSRWGSCSAVNNINLNIHLVRLPSHLCDYVLLHELVHTVHKNHGRQFWEMLHQLTGNARLLAREMRNYQTQVY